ncbi:hypothetical protein [Cohnella laeviribosi]|jgi:hypothetical protein|uniref:hypothetical protein n=1 Tax=Cohnella laeviribosi TaxID=380174 RepID=UPI00037C7AC2|nr:hypothetical protein [Cohnella laeviribosi]
MQSNALMFRFPNASAAQLAYETFGELGYDPQMHEGNRIHIHVIREDLISALEIAQSHGGELVEQAPADASMHADAAYGLDAIPIPAHTVNEDWVSSEAYSSGGLEDVEVKERFDPDSETYDHFEAR